MDNNYLDAARGYAKILKGEIEDTNVLYYCALISAFSVLSIAEYFDQLDAPGPNEVAHMMDVGAGINL